MPTCPAPEGGRGSGRAAAHPRRSLTLNAVYAVAGTGFYHGCQLGVIILLNKFAAPAVAGQYFLALAIALPVILFFGFELRGALIADVGLQFTVGTYRALRTAALVPAAAILAGYFIYATTTDTSGPFLAILAGMFAGRLAWAYAEVGWGTFQRRERLDLFALSYAARGLALLLPFVILLPLARDGTGQALTPAAAAGWAAVIHGGAYVAVYWLFDRPRARDARLWDLSWSWRGVRNLALQTAPLGVVALAINLSDSVPRWLFETIPDGAAQLGYFGSLAYITQAGNLVVIQATAAAANRLSQYYQRNLRAFLRLAGLLSGGAAVLGLLVLVVAVVFGRWILTVLYTPDYVQFQREFQLIVLAHALALLTNVLGAAVTQMRLFWVQVPVQLATLLATSVAAALLIPGPTPVLGGACTLLIRAAVQLTLYAACFALGLARRRPAEA